MELSQNGDGDGRKAWDHDDDLEKVSQISDHYIKNERDMTKDKINWLKAEVRCLKQDVEAAKSNEAQLRDNIRKLALPASTKHCRDCAVEVEDGDAYRYAECSAVSSSCPIHWPILTSTPQLRCGKCSRKYGETICEHHTVLGPQKMHKAYGRDCMSASSQTLRK